MDSARQALRWSIPGLVFVLELMLFATIWSAAGSSDPASVVLSVNTASAVIALFAGIPLGFLLYQLYYRNYRAVGVSLILIVRQPFAFLYGGRSGASKAWRFVRQDRGGEILRRYFKLGGSGGLVNAVWRSEFNRSDPNHERIKLVTKHRKLLKYGPRPFRVLALKEPLHHDVKPHEPMACRDCLNEYEQRFRWNWAVVLAMLDYCACGSTGAVELKREYASASDIYHALGAARTAIATAAAGSVIYQLVTPLLLHSSTDAPTARYLMTGSVVILVAAYLQYQVLHSARESCYRHLASRTAANLAWFSRQREQDSSADRRGIPISDGSIEQLPRGFEN